MSLINRLVFLTAFLFFNNASLAEEYSQASLQPILLAEFALQREQYDKAASIYLDAAREQPNNSDITERAAKLALHTRNLPAFLEMADLWHSNSANQSSRLHLALAYGFNYQHQQALDTMLPLLDQGASTNFSQITKLLDKQAVLNTGYLDKLEQAAAKHPNNLDLTLGNALGFSLADESKALNYLAEALKINSDQDISEYVLLTYKNLNRADLAIDYLHEQIQSQPYKRKLHNELLYIAESLDETVFQEQLTFLTRISPSNNRYLISLASIHLQQGQNQAAQQLLEQALSNDPGYSPAHLYLGIVHTRAKHFELAIQHLNAVHNVHDLWTAQEYLSYIYAETNEHEKVEQIIKQYFAEHELENSKASWINLRASSLEKAGKTKQALSFFEKAIKAQTDSIDLLYARAMFAERNNMLDLCEADLRHILSLNSEHAIALNALGYILTDRTDRHQEAFDLIKKAYALEPNDPATIDSMGWVLYHLDHPQKALEYLQRAYRMHPDAEVASHLIEVLWAIGETRQARALAKQALQNWPDDPALLKTVENFEI